MTLFTEDRGGVLISPIVPSVTVLSRHSQWALQAAARLLAYQRPH